MEEPSVVLRMSSESSRAAVGYKVSDKIAEHESSQGLGIYEDLITDRFLRALGEQSFMRYLNGSRGLSGNGFYQNHIKVS